MMVVDLSLSQAVHVSSAESRRNSEIMLSDFNLSFDTSSHLMFK